MPKSTKNDRPLKRNDLKGITIGLRDLPHRREFKFLCTMEPDAAAEHLYIINEKTGKNSDIRRRGLVYVFIVDGKLLKVGSTAQSFTERVQSYNCGTKSNRWNRGTCSTTNYFVLQSLLAIGKSIRVYAFFTPRITVPIFGKKESFPLPPKQWEKNILKTMKLKGKLPVLCTQT